MTTSVGKRATLACALALAIACGANDHEGSPEGGTDAGLDVGAETAQEEGGMQDAAFMEAPHAPYPQVPDQGGPIVAAPQLVTITFAGYSYEPTVTAFGDWIVTSSWLSVVGKDYGIGPGAHVAHVVLPGPVTAQMTDLQTQALLEQNLANGTIPSPDGADAGTPADAGAGAYLYMIFYPRDTEALGFLDGPSTCTYEGGVSFIGGYHWETQSGAYHVPYAVIPTCTMGTLTEEVGDVEVSASHELIESATDPFPYTQIAWGLTDPTSPWTFLDGEVADLCEALTTTESTFSAQRVWSNTAAAGDGSPCVPAPAGTFYATSPAPSSTQEIAAGESTTFTLTGFSTAPTPAWSIQAFTAYASFTPTIKLSADTVDNGQTVTLQVTVPAGTPAQSFASIIVSSYASASTIDPTSYWPVAVTVP
jgi:hypothetical protein